MRYLKYFAGAVTNRLPRLKGVSILRSHQAEISAAADPRVYLQVDGEYIGKGAARICIVPRALKLLMPAGYREAHG